MEVLDAIVKRRSIRKYKDVPIPKDIISDILMGGQFAPSAGNLQEWRFVVVDEEPIKEGISEACFSQSWMNEAPVHMIVCSDVSKIENYYGDRGKDLYSILNVGGAVENMILVATSHGLGTCWVSAFDEEKLSQLLGIPGNVRPFAVITLGYSNEEVPLPSKIDLQGLTFMNGYGSFHRIKDIDWLFNNYASIAQKSVKRASGGFAKTIKVVHKKLKTKIDKALKKKEN